MKKKNKTVNRTDNGLGTESGTRRGLRGLREVTGDNEELYGHIVEMVDMLPHSLFVIEPKSYRVRVARSDVILKDDPDRNVCHKIIYKEKRHCNEIGQPCIMEQIIQTGRFAVEHHCHRGDDGQERHYEVYGYPLRNSSGEIDCIVEYPQEVTRQFTAQREAELSLRNGLSDD